MLIVQIIRAGKYLDKIHCESLTISKYINFEMQDVNS